MKNFLFLLLFLQIACQLSGQSDYIVFGKGGGFTGEINAYKLYYNGKVLKGKGTAEIAYTEQGKIRKKESRKIFQKLEISLIEPFNQPGNMYYFIEIPIKGVVQRFTWGATGFSVPEAIKTIYQESMQKLSAIELQPVE